MTKLPSSDDKIFNLGTLQPNENGLIELPMIALESGRYKAAMVKMEDIDGNNNKTVVNQSLTATANEPLAIRPTFGANNDLYLLRVYRPNNLLLRYVPGVQSYTWFRFRLVLPVVIEASEPQIIEVEEGQNGFEYIGEHTAVFIQKVASDIWVIPRTEISERFRVISAESYGKEPLLNRHGNHYTVQDGNFHIKLILPSYGKVYLTNF